MESSTGSSLQASGALAEALAKNVDRLKLLKAEREALQTQLEAERKFFENERVILHEQIQGIYDTGAASSQSGDGQDAREARRTSSSVGGEIPAYALKPPQTGSQRRLQQMRRNQSAHGRVSSAGHGGLTSGINLGSLPPGTAGPRPPSLPKHKSSLRPKRMNSGHRRSAVGSRPGSRLSRPPSRQIATPRPPDVPLPSLPTKVQYTRPPSRRHRPQILPVETEKTVEVLAAGGRVARKVVQTEGGAQHKAKTAEISPLWGTMRQKQAAKASGKPEVPPTMGTKQPLKILGNDALSGAIAERMKLRKEIDDIQKAATDASNAVRLRRHSSDASEHQITAGALNKSDFHKRAQAAKQLLGADIEGYVEWDDAPASREQDCASEEVEQQGPRAMTPISEEGPPLYSGPHENVSTEEMAKRFAAIPIPSIGGVQLRPLSATDDSAQISRAAAAPSAGVQHKDPRVRRRRARGHQPASGSEQGFNDDRMSVWSEDPAELALDVDSKAATWVSLPAIRELPPLPPIPEDLDFSGMSPDQAEKSINELSDQLRLAIQHQREAAEQILISEREELQSLITLERQRIETEIAKLQAQSLDLEDEDEALSMSSKQFQVTLLSMQRHMAEMQSVQAALAEQLAAGEAKQEDLDALAAQNEKLEQMKSQYEIISSRPTTPGESTTEYSGSSSSGSDSDSDTGSETTDAYTTAGDIPDVSNWALAASSIVPADNVLFEEPTDEEVTEYAVYLGMDPVKDHDLLWIARQAMTANVPDGWERFLDGDENEFYYNRAQNYSTYEHPMDGHFRKMAGKAKEQKVARGLA